nr:N-acetylglucosamine-6-phosphate deacetylase [uncultured Agathobaculum sp.]
MEYKNLKVFQPDGTFRTGGLCIEGERIVPAAPSTGARDMGGMYAIPGLIDLHFHGCMGYDFCDGTHEAISAIAKYQAKNGVAAICPATMTYPEDKLASIARTAASYRIEPDGAALIGINMEGPFFSAAKKGAQNGAYLHAPDADMFRRLQRAANGLFRLCDLSPELPGAMDTIEALAGEVRLSIAHTEADYDTACEAIRRGARQVTHLFNAMPPLSHRAPGVIGAAADHDEVMVELIADGVHIHPAVVRSTFKLFAGRVILISDSMMATGLADGEYSLGGQAVTVRGNRATLHDGTIAGSATNLLDCVRSAVRMGIPLGQAVQAASTNPARALGVQQDYGSLEPGKLANVLLLDENLNIDTIILRGQPISV